MDEEDRNKSFISRTRPRASITHVHKSQTEPLLTVLVSPLIINKVSFEICSWRKDKLFSSWVKCFCFFLLLSFFCIVIKARHRIFFDRTHAGNYFPVGCTCIKSAAQSQTSGIWHFKIKRFTCPVSHSAIFPAWRVLYRSQRCLSRLGMTSAIAFSFIYIICYPDLGR